MPSYCFFESCCSLFPILFWLLGDALLHSSSLLHADPVEGTLTIKETLDVDAGVYTCVAVNAAGTASGKISLDVGGKSVQVIQKAIKFQTACDSWSSFKTSSKTAEAHIEDSLTVCEI